MSLLQKYRKEETRKTTPEEEKRTPTKEPLKKADAKEKPIAPKETRKKLKNIAKEKTPGIRSRPVISATVSLELVDALNVLTDEKYLNRSKFIEDALIRTIKTEFPDIAKRYSF
ncbi:MAG: hypothetical protein ACTSQ0_00080 [Candidatus Heimdallarchaeota archaeon]